MQQDTGTVKGTHFSRIYSDFGTDINQNGLYDLISINVGIIVLSPGEYIVRGSLYSADGNECIDAINGAHLGFGAKSIRLDFYGSRVVGKHYLKNLTLYDAQGNLIDTIDNAYITKNNYYLIEDGPWMQAKLIGNYTDYGADANGDGLYDYLIIDAGVDVKAPGEYSLMGYLNDSEDNEIAWTIDHGMLSSGNHSMHLSFDGNSINSHRIGGPYHLRSLTLFSGSSPTELRICDFLEEAYATSAYNYSEFLSVNAYQESFNQKKIQY
ncbi:MAG: hypothetical protein ACE14P_00510 [Methanotrichaceae archaeon]